MENLPSTVAPEYFHEKILEILDPLVPKKPENPRIWKMKIQRLRRKLWRRHAKVERRLSKACSLSTRCELLQKKWELQRQLADDYTASNNMEEDEAVLRIRQNPCIFSGGDLWTVELFLLNSR